MIRTIFFINYTNPSSNFLLRHSILILFSFSVFISINLFSQDAISDFQKVDIEVNGIPFNQFSDILQDQEGYLWLSTNEGLLKYDGYEVKAYKNSKEDSTSIANNDVRKLYVDHKGALWVGTQIGISRYNKVCDCFDNYYLTFSKQPTYLDTLFEKTSYGITNETVQAIVEDQNKKLWIATLGNGLYQYDNKKNEFIPFLNQSQHPYSLENRFINELLVDQNNQLWIGTQAKSKDIQSGLIRLNLNTRETKIFVHEPEDTNSLIDSRVTALLEDRQGQILVGTYQTGLHLYHPDEESFTRLKFDPKQPNVLHASFNNEKIFGDHSAVNFLYQDQHERIWVSAYNEGLYCFDKVNDEMRIYKHDPAQASEFNNNYFRAIHEDRQGQLWVSLDANGGLHKRDHYARKIKYYPSLKRPQRSCQSKTETDVFWISSMGEGLKRLNRKTGEIMTYLHDENDINSIGSNHVRAVYEDSNGTLWLGLGDGGYGNSQSGKGGLDIFDPRTGIFTHHTFQRMNREDETLTVFSLFEDVKGRLWFDTGPGGIYRSDTEKKNFASYLIKGAEEAELWLIPETHNQTLWVVDFTNRRIYRFDVEKDQFQLIIEGDATEALVEDESGYWIATWNNGLLHYDPKNRVSKRYTEHDGLLSNETIDILSTEVGTYWIATRKGITKFDASTEIFYNEGLPKGYFHPMWLKSREGQLFFGASNGVFAFYPDEVNGNPISPELTFSQLEISGEPIPLKKNIKRAYKELEFKYYQNDFKIDYVGLHFGDPSKNKYQYKLIPLEENWIDVGNQRSVRYNNLAPNQYTFLVKAANSDGVWTKKALTLDFQIRTAWWKKWWFYLLSLFFVLSSIYWLYHFQLSRKFAVEKSQRLQEINQFKSNLYTNITHEFRTPLTVILGVTKNLQKQSIEQDWQNASESLGMIERNGNNLLRLINEILDLAKLERGHLELQLQQADVIPFVKYLSESFHPLAIEKNISLTVDVAQESLIMDFDATKLASIVSNLLSNAIKFTPEGGKVKVSLHSALLEQEAYFFLKVKDTGRGLSIADLSRVFDRFYQVENFATRTQEGTGIGLALTKELVELMQGMIEVESQLGKGSEFVVKLRITKTAPLAELPIRLASFNQSVASFTTSVPETVIDEQSDLPLVLIIEDRKDVAYYIGTCLEGKYQYLHASNGKIGIEMALEQIPDLIIADVMMPEKDGFEVCTTLKTDERTNHIPIILLTAKVEVKDRLKGLSQGADAYLAKPFEKEELLLRLHHLFELRKTLQQKYKQQFLEEDFFTQQEDSFVAKARAIVLAELGNEDFSIHDLAEQLFLSRSQLHRKIKALTGYSSTIFIRSIRLHEAKKLLITTNFSVSEIAYQVGFKTPLYFYQIFKETFGDTPSSLRK